MKDIAPPPLTQGRKHERLNIRLAAELSFADGGRYRLITHNLGFGGAFLLGACLHLRHGQACRVLLYPPAQLAGGRPIRLWARVSQVQPNGSALRFIASSAEQYRQFADMMLAHSPQPDWLRLELEATPGYQCEIA